ncbi:MAG: ABC transporter permease subunit [Proteobacteria bacterium]|nr:ABC transporter permease subunit [Pseudomonadota bacterium]MCP4917141.1 ABC transporter permease subunit [Pseudomonadota bacterium]
MTGIKNVFAIAWREIRAYFATPVGWLCLCAFMAISAVFFVAVLGLYNMQATEMQFNPYAGTEMNIDEYLVAPFFGNTTVILLFICPALSMRLFSEDRKTKSLELLLTSPVTTTEIVLGKYLGAVGFLAIILLCTGHYPLQLVLLGEPDPGVIASSYLAVFLLGSCFMAVGLLFSSMTENQIVALVLSFVTLLGFWILGWVEELASGTLQEVVGYASLINRMEDMTKGLIHTKDLVYYVTFICFWLFATHQRVEAYRWR